MLGVLEPGAASVLWTHSAAGLLLKGDGLLSGARDLTTDYVKQRVQVNRLLVEFQGAAIQMADVYVTSRMVGLAADEVSRRPGRGCVLVLRPGASRAADLLPPARRDGR